MPESSIAKTMWAQLCAVGFGAVLVTLGAVGVWNLLGAHRDQLQSGSRSAAFSDSCNVIDLQIYGQIVGTRAEVPVADTISANDGSGALLTPTYTAASDVRYNLDIAKDDPKIKALIVDIDSGGGGAEAGHEIALAIKSFGKPTVAVIHGLGASSAYLAASAADKIYALEDSDVGSIGVTSSFVNYSEKNKKDGVTYEQLSSGPFKDMFSPDKPLTAAERALVMSDIKVLRDNFVKMVAENRHQTYAKIDALADGSTLLGQKALDNGLIDAIGSWTDARAYIKAQIDEPVVLCWQ